MKKQRAWILSVISAWIALVPFYFIWKIIREVLAVAPDFGQAQNLSSCGWSAVGFAILSMAVYVGALMCSHIAAFRVQANMRSQMMHHIVTLPMGFMDKEGSGKIRKIVNESSAATEAYLAHQLPDQAGALATPTGLLVLLLAFDWRLGLLSLVPVVLAFLIMGAMTGKRMQQKMEEYQNALDEMSSEAVEYVLGIPVVKTFGQSVFSFKRFQSSIKKYEKWTIAYTEELRLPMVGYTTVINSVFAVLIATAFFFTASDAYLLNLLFYIIITPIITVTLNKIMFASENKLIVADALARIDSILDKKPLPETKNARDPKDKSVAFDHVSFRYEGAAKDALHDISLNIKEGEHIAFVGPSGGGKTTLASLVARFFDTTEGNISIGGVNVKDIPSEKLMELVSFVFQDSKLLKMSICDNVRMGKKDATREEVLEALKNAQCQDIIDKLPNGIDTVIGSQGTYVSGGEAQRLSSVVNADRICVLKDGEILESGTHSQLLNEQGMYAHMWEEYNKSVCWKVGA